MPEQDKSFFLNRAKGYSNLKYFLSILEVIYLLILLLVFLNSGLSKALAEWLLKLTANNYLVLALYLLAAGLAYYCVNLPLNLYHSYILEHRFSLSTQGVRAWFVDQIKSGLISYVIALILLTAFYFILRHSQKNWWLFVSGAWIFFSLILAKLLPVVIIPIFFKYKKLSDDNLRERIMHLADKMQVKILDIFQINFSKKTLKGNAAFVGIGNTRRVILADTLKDKYSPDEIEVILAHEFAHYKLKHLLKLVLMNSLGTILSFYLIFITNSHTLSFFGLSSLSDVAGLPLVIIYLILIGIIFQPIANYISRRLERNADRQALKVTGLKEAFISMMEKLSLQNLADRRPLPIIKFFFFDHPPIDERIDMAKSFKPLR